MLQAQATEQLRAESYERTEERKGYRNGTYPHQLYSGRHHYASRPPDSRREVLNGATCPLPTQRTSSGPGLDGDGSERGVDAKGGPDYRRVMRYGVFEIHGVRTVQAVRSGCDDIGTTARFMITHARLSLSMRWFSKCAMTPRLIVRRIIGIGGQHRWISRGFGLHAWQQRVGSQLREFFGWMKSRGLRCVDLIVSDDHGITGQVVKITWRISQTSPGKYAIFPSMCLSQGCEMSRLPLPERIRHSTRGNIYTQIWT